MKPAPADQVWRALADPTRRAILDQLAGGPKTTGELVARFDGLCRTAVMKHLDLLSEASLLVVRREGRKRWNHLNPVPIQRVCDRWVSRHVRGLATAMSRLKDHVEGPRTKTNRGEQECPPKPKRKSRSTSSRSKSRPPGTGDGRP